MSASRERVEIAVIVVHETAKAYLVTEADDDKQEYWLPKSQCEIVDWTNKHTKRGRVATASIPEWLAEEKGLL